jgi:hypothetical protein
MKAVLIIGLNIVNLLNLFGFVLLNQPVGFCPISIWKRRITLYSWINWKTTRPIVHVVCKQTYFYIFVTIFTIFDKFTKFTNLLKIAILLTKNFIFYTFTKTGKFTKMWVLVHTLVWVVPEIHLVQKKSLVVHIQYTCTSLYIFQVQLPLDCEMPCVVHYCLEKHAAWCVTNSNSFISKITTSISFIHFLPSTFYL